LILKEKHKTKMKYALKCSNCGARTDWYDWLCDASIAWNRRAVEDILHKRIAELEQYHNF
jgi:lipopolysaccharide biosynthesis regulator YciM